MLYNIAFIIGMVFIAILICYVVWMLNGIFGFSTVLTSIESKWCFSRRTSVLIHGKQKHFNTLHDAMAYLHQEGIDESKIICSSWNHVWLEVK